MYQKFKPRQIHMCAHLVFNIINANICVHQILKLKHIAFVIFNILKLKQTYVCTKYWEFLRWSLHNNLFWSIHNWCKTLSKRQRRPGHLGFVYVQSSCIPERITMKLEVKGPSKLVVLRASVDFRLRLVWSRQRPPTPPSHPPPTLTI